MEPYAKNSALQQLIVQKLVNKRADASPDAALLAASAAECWGRIAATVAPVIGSKGMQAVYARSLYLGSIAYPRLAAVDSGPDGAPFAALQAQLAACDYDEAVAAANALFNHFIALLAALIGASLTARLLQAAAQDAPLTPARQP